MRTQRWFSPPKYFSAKKILAFLGFASCRKQKTNPPKIGTSLQNTVYIPPLPPRNHDSSSRFRESEYKKHAPLSRFQGGRGEISTVFCRDVPIFGGSVFCCLQLANPKIASIFFAPKYVDGENHLCVLIINVKKHFFIYLNYLYK